MIKLNNKEVMFEKFPNGETRLVKESISIKEDMQKVIFKYEDDGDLIRLLFLKKYLDSFSYDNNILYISYMPYSRMDRSENNSPFTLKYVSEFINSLNFKKVIIIEPHSNVTPALVDKSHSKYINFDLLPIVLEEIHFDKNKDYLYFPDTGASKRYHNLKGYKQLVGHKDRDFETGEITSLKVIGDTTCEPNKVIILDDLSSYGGTFVHSSIALKELGFKEVYLLVVHAENSIFKGKLFIHVDKVFTTDSILTDKENINKYISENKLKVFNIEGVLYGE